MIRRDGGGGPSAAACVAEAPLLRVRDLVKHFPVRGGGIIPRTVGQVQAVSGVSFDVDGGGDARAGRRVRLRQVDGGPGRAAAAPGHLRLGAVRGPRADHARSRASCAACGAHLQIVFQDPFASLNPRWTINNIVAEPLQIHGVARAACSSGWTSCWRRSG